MADHLETKTHRTVLGTPSQRGLVRLLNPTARAGWGPGYQRTRVVVAD